MTAIGYDNVMMSIRTFGLQRRRERLQERLDSQRWRRQADRYDRDAPPADGYRWQNVTMSAVDITPPCPSHLDPYGPEYQAILKSWFTRLPCFEESQE